MQVFGAQHLQVAVVLAGSVLCEVPKAHDIFSSFCIAIRAAPVDSKSLQLGFGLQTLDVEPRGTAVTSNPVQAGG